MINDFITNAPKKVENKGLEHLFNLSKKLLMESNVNVQKETLKLISLFC